MNKYGIRQKKHVFGLIVALFCAAGCQPIVGPAPIGRPMPHPIGQPISQPGPQPYPHPVGRPISQPVGQPVSYPSPPVIQPISQTRLGIFVISGTPKQQEIIKKGLSRCSFPFERLKPGLRKAGLSSVKISWESMGNGTLGWASTGGEVGINNTISGDKAHQTLIMELGHIVDFFYLTPQMRSEITKNWHPGTPDNHEWFGSTRYWDRNGEAYSTLFLWAFADKALRLDAGYSHKPSQSLADQLRVIMLPQTTR